MKTLHTEIEVHAPPERVWEALVDFERYPDWNPFIVEVLGAAEQGAELRVTLAPLDRRAVTVKPIVTEAVPGRSLEWLGRLGVPGVFDGRHRFELHDFPNGTRLVQREVFTGLLVPLFARTLAEGTCAGFTAMNAALKVRAERLVTIPAPR